MARIAIKEYIMKSLFTFLLFLALSTQAQGKVNIFACEPEWASLAEEIAGGYAQVYSATTAAQDPHHIEARPSLIAKVRRADLIFCSGAELEQGWLPLLLRSAGNSKVMPGQPGYLEAALQVQRLGIPDTTLLAVGDLHSQGNPHVHLDPNRLLKVAGVLVQRLSRIDPEHATSYQENQLEFSHKLHLQMTETQPIVEMLKGKKVVVYHDNWRYLWDWLGINQVATIESTPGLPPSSGDLKKLIQRLQNQPVDMIVISTYQNERAAKWLAEKLNKPLIKLPYTVGGDEHATDLTSLYQQTLKLLSL